jgi:hypothetical protein
MFETPRHASEPTGLGCLAQAARSPALIWATGRDVIRPPARAFEVLSKTGRGAQEPAPVFDNLALPLLVVEMR